MGKGMLARAIAAIGVSAAMLTGFGGIASAEGTQESAGTADPVTVAVTCSGTGCDDKDPVDSGCAASGGPVASRLTTKGRFYLYYSSVCRTNWVRVPDYAGGSSRADGKLELTVWDVPRNKVVRFLAPATRGLHYGNMVYSPGSNCAWGFADWTGGDWDVRIPSGGC